MTQDTVAGIRLNLEGALSIRTVETIHVTLREAIEPPFDVSNAAIAIDCSAATEIDLAFIQLLIATRISAQRLGKAVTLAECPDGALLDTLTRGGFQIVCESGTGEIPAFWFEGTHA